MFMKTPPPPHQYGAETAEASGFTGERSSPWIKGQPVENHVCNSVKPLGKQYVGIWIEDPGLNLLASFISLMAAALLGVVNGPNPMWQPHKVLISTCM